MVSTSFSYRNLLLIAAALQIVWGLVPSASNLVIREIPVEAYIALRWTISGLILCFYTCAHLRWLPPLGKETFAVAALGIAGYALASFGTLYGLKIGGVTNFALMNAFNPIVTSLTSILILKERPTREFFIALPLCVLGLLLLVLGKHELSSWRVALSSSLLIIGAAVLEAVIFVYSRKYKAHFTSVQYMTIAQLAAAGFMWALQIGVLHQTGTLSQLSATGWAAAVFVSVVACVLCYLILYWLLNHVDGHRLALFDGLHTLSATFFGIALFNEALNGLMIFGGGFLLTGLVLGNLRAAKTANDP